MFQSTRNKVFILILAFISLGLWHQQAVSAAGAPFDVQIQPPKNPHQTNNSYFDLLVKPNQKQAITVKVTSTVNKPQVVTLTPTNAATSQNASVSYTAVGLKPDTSMKYPFTSFAPQATKIPLEAGQAKDVTVSFTTPNAQVPGVILGGLYLLSNLTDDAGKKGSVMFTQKYGYGIAVQMMMQDKTNVKPDLKWQQVTPTVQGLKPYAKIRLRNDQANYIKQGRTTITVTAQFGDKAKAVTKASSFAVAPNSQFDYLAKFPGKSLTPGTYRVQMRVDTMDGLSWTFDKRFTVTQTTADKLNKQLGVKPDNKWLWYLIGGLVVLLLILAFVMVYVIGRRKGKKPDAE